MGIPFDALDARPKRPSRAERAERNRRWRLSDRMFDELVMQLVAARCRAGLTQAQVADRMRTTRSAVSRLESGAWITTIPIVDEDRSATGAARPAAAIAPRGRGRIVDDIVATTLRAAVRRHIAANRMPYRAAYWINGCSRAQRTSCCPDSS